MIKRASEKESVDAALLWHFGTFVPLGNMTKRSSLDLAAFYSRHDECAMPQYYDMSMYTIWNCTEIATMTRLIPLRTLVLGML